MDTEVGDMRSGSIHMSDENVSVCDVVNDKVWSATELEPAGSCISRWLSVEDGTSSNCEGAIDSVSALSIDLESECTFR